MSNEPTLTLGTVEDGASVVLDSTCLLVFVDETGDELFSDPQHPVFGLGGCAVLVGDYVNFVRPAWRKMKDQHFDGADSTLHASELGSPSKEQLNALSQFFALKRFARLAAIASGRSVLPNDYSPYQIVSRAFLARVERIALRFSFSRIVLLVESSERANVLAERHVGPYNKADVEYFGRTVHVPIDHYFVPKTMNEPGIEVADFVMHAVGGQVRSECSGLAPGFRKDFTAVFRDVPRELVEYMNIQEVAIHDA
ncbi:MAG: hypothetical protein FD134_2251 [Gallionellaceae bacterium]|nr:MAG: hypothetical protein FD134_2251 [Gallionellaceae bacterium]